MGGVGWSNPFPVARGTGRQSVLPGRAQMGPSTR
jgi:hypothetical protein